MIKMASASQESQDSGASCSSSSGGGSSGGSGGNDSSKLSGSQEAAKRIEDRFPGLDDALAEEDLILVTYEFALSAEEDKQRLEQTLKKLVEARKELREKERMIKRLEEKQKKDEEDDQSMTTEEIKKLQQQIEKMKENEQALEIENRRLTNELQKFQEVSQEILGSEADKKKMSPAAVLKDILDKIKLTRNALNELLPPETSPKLPLASAFKTPESTPRGKNVMLKSPDSSSVTPGTSQGKANATPPSVKKQKLEIMEPTLDYVNQLIETADSESLRQSRTIRNHGCPHCPMLCATLGALKMHMSGVHGVLKPYRDFHHGCQFCGGKFRSMGDKNRHRCEDFAAVSTATNLVPLGGVLGQLGPEMEVLQEQDVPLNLKAKVSAASQTQEDDNEEHEDEN